MRAQFAHGGMVVALHLIGQRQVERVEDARFRPEETQQAYRLLGRQARIGAVAQRAVEQQYARRVAGAERQRRTLVRVAEIERREVIRVGKLAQPDAGRRPRSYQGRDAFTIRTTDSITGTSTSTPTTVASAAPDWKPNSAMAVATANSKKLLAPISVDGPATHHSVPSRRFSH